MAESAALLVDDILPEVPVRQWVPSFPYVLRFLFAPRPAIAGPRLSLTPSGNVRYQLKTPYRDGTTHIMLLRASCPSPFGPAFGCSKSLPAILSSRWISWRVWRRWCRARG